MDLDPIVLLAYIVFWLRRRRQKLRKNIKAPTPEKGEAVFLKPYVPPGRRLTHGVEAASRLSA